MIAIVPSQAAAILPTLHDSASAMVAFDTWLDNHDRINDGNLVVGYDLATTAYTHAYIDFAHSMSCTQNYGISTSIHVPVGPFPANVILNLNVLAKAVSAIEQMKDGEIQAVVNRIPQNYLTPPQKNAIQAGLINRRDQLRPALQTKYGQFP